MGSVLLIFYVFCVVFCLSLLSVLRCPMLPVSMDCKFSIVPSVRIMWIVCNIQYFVLNLDITYRIEEVKRSIDHALN